MSFVYPVKLTSAFSLWLSNRWTKVQVGCGDWDHSHCLLSDEVAKGMNGFPRLLLVT